MTMANSAPESPSRIPVTLRRSSSLRQKGEQQRQRHGPFPAITESADGAAPPRRASSSLSLQHTPSPRPGRRGGAPRRSPLDDSSDLDSVRSFGSSCSNLSAATAACEHAHFGLNGTTWSARARRYVVHCGPREAEQYLTPTQRSARQLRHLQGLLQESRRELEERDREVARLTRELVELRLLKAGEGAGARVDEGQRPSPEDKPASLVDSGHFEEAGGGHFERRIDEMQRRQQDELRRLKQAHHERLEGLLDQLAEARARPARERELREEVERLRRQLEQSHELLADREERSKRALLEVYAKGQQAARLEQPDRVLDDGGGGSGGGAAKVTVAQLLQQLTVAQAELDNVKQLFQESSCYPARQPNQLALACRSQSLLSLHEAVSLWVLGTRKAMYRRILESRNKQNALDPEITLQFLKSAIYYFLTDKENLQGHLNAIESILGFTDTEKLNIDKIYRSAKK